MLSTGLAMAASTTAAQPQGGGSFGVIGQLVVLGLIFVIFYFLLIRPQQKQQKKLLDMRASLKKGDRIITTGGIYGVIISITDEIVSLQIADKVKIDVAKSSIAARREEGN